MPTIRSNFLTNFCLGLPQKQVCWLLAACVILASLQRSYANSLLSNSGFESDLAGQTKTLLGWNAYGGNAYSETSSTLAHGGVNYCKVYGQFVGANNYTGIYQDNPSAPGAIYAADGWVYSLSSDNIKGQNSAWIEVSFRDANYNALALYRSAIVTSNNIAGFGGLSKWFDLPITNRCTFTSASALTLLPGAVTNTVASLVAPAGTVYVRYQVFFQQGSDNANGSIYFDDLTLNQTGGTVVVPPVTQQNIVWSDEFNGSSINTGNWAFETGGGGWGNNELENYTSRTNNARIVNGQLVIEADQESYGGSSYTSARMKTQGKCSWTYGRIEARIKIPRGQGIWPAFWMLGADIGSVSWPTCGEIDIMENIGKTSDQGTVHGTIHGPQLGGDYNGGGGVSGTYTLPDGAALADDFHIYAVEWTPSRIAWFLDSNQYFAATPASLPGGSTWVFTQPQFILLNLAVGGNWPGNPDGTTIFPQQMVVDYVRVYQQTAPLQISATQSNSNVVLSWPTNIVCHLQAQTNSLLNGNWSDISNVTNPLNVSLDPNSANVFFRLASP
jgi:beta-glucanase (GH16 family)